MPLHHHYLLQMWLAVGIQRCRQAAAHLQNVVAHQQSYQLAITRVHAGSTRAARTLVSVRETSRNSPRLSVLHA
ncbi:hypothetical protein [Pararhodobacter sp.]|uniref:hypothetical protein n=1 Tax=Pararhodobacter sp. TaxID=2127056 RepID=UPI002FDCFD16